MRGIDGMQHVIEVLRGSLAWNTSVRILYIAGLQGNCNTFQLGFSALLPTRGNWHNKVNPQWRCEIVNARYRLRYVTAFKTVTQLVRWWRTVVYLGVKSCQSRLTLPQWRKGMQRLLPLRAWEPCTTNPWTSDITANCYVTVVEKEVGRCCFLTSWRSHVPDLAMSGWMGICIDRSEWRALWASSSD